MKAQEVIITLHDSVKLRTSIIYIVENQMKTKAGDISLAEIHSVRFQTESDAKQELVVPLVNAGIAVYAANKKLAEADISKTPLQSNASDPKPTYTQWENVNPASEANNVASLGIGLGWDYGFLGARFTLPVSSGIGFFAGGGYTLVDFGYNLGAMAYLSKKRAVPTISFMYGTNATIYVSGAPQLGKSFTGTTLGLGIMTKKRSKPDYWHFQLLVPFRSSDFDTYYNNLINSGAIQSYNKPLPVNISVGYHFIIQ